MKYNNKILLTVPFLLVLFLHQTNLQFSDYLIHVIFAFGYLKGQGHTCSMNVKCNHSAIILLCIFVF